MRDEGGKERERGHREGWKGKRKSEMLRGLRVGTEKTVITLVVYTS